MKLADHTPDDRTGVPAPTYDRTALSAGIVHFGLGNFHRAHQAMYLDRLLSDGSDPAWAISGVGVLPGDVRMRDALAAQDHLYTLVLKHPDGRNEARIIGSIVDFQLALDDPDAVVERLAAPSTRIVSLTITEGGYNIDHVTGRFDVDAPAIALDAADPTTPRTVFGLIAEGLRRRRDRGIPPFTVMSCDNLPHNGAVARQSIVAYAELVDPSLAQWIAASVSFPSSMVDRITPVTTDADREALRREFALDDAWPVVCEPFVQWVLEDDFPLGRPDWARAGVQLVDDVAPYELMKLRLLNASHQAMAYFGHLLGLTYAHEATADPDIAELLRRYMLEEGRPTLPPVPGIDLDDYTATLLERFGNPAIADTLARLCAESSDRIPKWVLPVIRENLTAGRPADLAIAVVASWARYAEGVDETGAPIAVVDAMRDELTPLARAYADDELAFLRDRRVFGDLVDDARFTDPYRRTLRDLHELGARKTLQRLLGRG